MNGHPEQRRAARLPVPGRFRGDLRGGKAVQVLDLSAAGARIEHGEPLSERSILLALPPVLGGGQVRAEVIWSYIAGYKPFGAGQSGLVYQSGLAFPSRTPAEHATLTRALGRIAGASALGRLRTLRQQLAPAPVILRPRHSG